MDIKQANKKRHDRQKARKEGRDKIKGKIHYTQDRKTVKYNKINIRNKQKCNTK